MSSDSEPSYPSFRPETEEPTLEERQTELAGKIERELQGSSHNRIIPLSNTPIPSGRSREEVDHLLRENESLYGGALVILRDRGIGLGTRGIVELDEPAPARSTTALITELVRGDNRRILMEKTTLIERLGGEVTVNFTALLMQPNESLERYLDEIRSQEPEAA